MQQLAEDISEIASATEDLTKTIHDVCSSHAAAPSSSLGTSQQDPDLGGTGAAQLLVALQTSLDSIHASQERLYHVRQESGVDDGVQEVAHGERPAGRRRGDAGGEVGGDGAAAARRRHGDVARQLGELNASHQRVVDSVQRELEDVREHLVDVATRAQTMEDSLRRSRDALSAAHEHVAFVHTVQDSVEAIQTCAVSLVRAHELVDAEDGREWAVDAAMAVQEAWAALEPLPQDAKDSTVCVKLAEEVGELRESIVERALAVVREQVCTAWRASLDEQGQDRLARVEVHSSTLINDSLRALSLLGRSRDGATVVARQIVQDVLETVVLDMQREHTLSASVDEAGQLCITSGGALQAHSDGPIHESAQSRSADVACDSLACLTLCCGSLLPQVLRVHGPGFANDVLLELWPMVGVRVVAACLEPNVPERVSRQGKFARVVRAATDLSRAVRRRLSPLPLPASPLDQWIDNSVAASELADTHSRVGVLAEARELILSNRFEMWEEDERDEELRDQQRADAWADVAEHLSVDGDLLAPAELMRTVTDEFHQEFRHKVSVNANKLVLLLHRTLYDACISDHDRSRQLFLAARDIIHLFLAISPAHFGAQLKSIPHIAMLFYNDCMFLAHHLTALQSAYVFPSRDRLLRSAPKAAPPTLVDLVAPLRRLGQQYFFAQLLEQRQSIVSLLAKANGFGNLHEEQRYATCKQCLRQALFVLSKLCRTWRAVLPAHAFSALFSALVEMVAATVSGWVLAEGDIGIATGKRMHALMLHVETSITELHEQHAPGDLDGHVASLEELAPSWSRVPALVRIIAPEQSLVGLQDEFASGAYNMLEVDEMKSLVRALFTDSPKRDACLALFDELESQAALRSSTAAVNDLL